MDENKELEYIEEMAMVEPIILNQEEIKEYPDFKIGVNKALEFCGMYSAMISSGIPHESTVELILNIFAAETNIKVVEIEGKTKAEQLSEEESLKL